MREILKANLKKFEKIKILGNLKHLKELNIIYFRKPLKKSNAIKWNFSKKYKKLRGLLNEKVFK